LSQKIGQKNELAQHLAEDPLPLSRAKISAEAAVKKAEKTQKQAEEARLKAVEAGKAAESAKAQAEEAVKDTNEKLKEAEKELEIAAANSEQKGAIWWAQRELDEAKKYMPKSKGGTW